MEVAKAERKAQENMSQKVTLTTVQIETIIVDAITLGWKTSRKFPNHAMPDISIEWPPSVTHYPIPLVTVKAKHNVV